MKALVALLKELLGLFFDDGRLAIAVLAILAATALLQLAGPFAGLAAAAFLVAGIIAALLENVIRTARAMRDKR
jgi:hypothetical protein